jgi:serine/threonine protein kinase
MRSFSKRGFGSIGSLESLIICQDLSHEDLATTKLVKTQGQKRKYYTLKVYSKSALVASRRVYNVRNEKEILLEVRHPFVVKLLRTFNDEANVYLLLEYLPGGEFFTFVRNNSCLPNDVALFYGAEIVLALSHLHSLDIAYRNLRPEHVLLTKHGHIKLIDFSSAKRIRGEERSNTSCGALAYMAPEVISGLGHTKAVDWWAFGVLLYEMLVGLPPFYDEDPQKLYAKILTTSVSFPRHIEETAQDLISSLLQVNPDSRLGSRNAEEVTEHLWFDGVDFDMVVRKEIDPPWVPVLKKHGDTSYYPLATAATTDADSAPLGIDPLADF